MTILDQIRERRDQLARDQRLIEKELTDLEIAERVVRQFAADAPAPKAPASNGRPGPKLDLSGARPPIEAPLAGMTATHAEAFTTDWKSGKGLTEIAADWQMSTDQVRLTAKKLRLGDRSVRA